ncbi:alpha/beta hydrolase [Dysgonomonas sp. HGC4]|uniref:alpha/beta hydrolase n=1 Tax=Dysgonomonas sp. HGC4 TaxID=1658009 RepID=UPI000683725B|nr:alpha/beta hydrolase-fold protein [Dysgonomonas sp. HGC4]MBD8348279.1 alpha/beta hydrolase [Dysgonomonas sp. HGC4]
MKIKLLFIFLIVLLASCKQQPHKKEIEEFILGYIDNVHSEILNEDRVLNIYLPDDYDKDTKYPVIYLLDGSADEDFIHIVGIVQYNTFPWVDRVPKSIVVGIANTNRKRNFTSPSSREADKKLIPDNGGSEKFISFIEKELQPYIEAKYKTSDSKTIIGQSLGGLLATEILFTKPQLFTKYIIISPSLWWKDGALLNDEPRILNADYTVPTDVYIAVGKEGSIDGSKNHIMEEDAKLLAEKIRTGQSKYVNVYFDYLPEENHATVTHQAVFNAFRALYPKK